MKTFRIEVQRVKRMSNQHGLVHALMDASVQPSSARDEEEPATVLSMDEATARTFFLLLKAQLAEFDKRKARSQR